MFREAIQSVVDRIDGGVAGVLMGFDGISVEGYQAVGPEVDPQAKDINEVGMELAHVLTQVRRAAESLEVGVLDEVTVKAEKLTVVVRLLNEEYFLACAVGPGGNVGKARHLLRITAPKIVAEL